MGNITTVIILLAIITALAQITDKIKVPYPIMLVIAGIMISLIPGLPPVTLDAEIVFLLFLPPVLYSAAWNTSLIDFKEAIRPISMLAIGCVLFTTTLVAVVAHYFIPGFGWAESFVLGAIISPPDAVAATSATKGLKLPRRVITILEGESLVNDATGLIAYRYAVSAVATGSFIWWLVSINFFYVAIMGIVVGLVAGVVFRWIHKITPDNAITDTTFTLLAPFTAYLLAEEIHCSGVLSVVTCGLFLSYFSSEIFDHRARLQATAVWEILIFLVNGIIFILIGLQLPMILENIQDHTLGELIAYGALISLATIVVRLIWIYPGAYLPRWLNKGIRQREAKPTIGAVTVVGWAGMRGVVSLAAALALPLTVGEGIAFPNRDFIIFLTFSVIFATLVLQGLTLPVLIRWLKVTEDNSIIKEHDQEARLKIAFSAIEHIESNYSLALSSAVLDQIKTKYEIRIHRMRRDETERKLTDDQIKEFLLIQKELIHREREEIRRLKKESKINEEVLRKIEYELDLEESRLMMELE
ncbi:MAG: Na+/H+ antiporter [Cyclobacteriaceae bacterium]|nr:Na+/H+ antiporter [Cyclobacteriaceae bacterium]